jgi:pyruvyl transferase EpsO
VSTISHLKLIEDLQRQVEASLDEHITGEPMAIVDFPDIRNVGDSAIWLGELAYLAKRKATNLAYVSRMRDFSEAELQARAPTGPIFIHGGGNFGDIWLPHQDFRERVMKRWPGRPVVQFAQSIHFGSPARAEQTARVISKHGNFTLFVRDEASKEFSEKHFDCRVLLCPDMAVCLGALKAPSPDMGVLAMLRGDREKAGSHDFSAHPHLAVEDWVTEPWLPIRVAKAIGAAGALRTFDPMRMRLSRFNAAANQRLGRGLRQIGRARAIVTDRLHVHVLSLLLGKPHAVLDNSYGKIAGFMGAFSGGTNLSYRAKSLADAVEWARAQ